MEEFIERIDNKPGRGRSGTVNNWETGKNAPNKQRLKKIADLGGVSVDYLINGNHSSAVEIKDLFDKFLHSPADLTKEEEQKVNAAQFEVLSLVRNDTNFQKKQAQNRINEEQAAFSEYPLSIVGLQTYGFFLSLFNLIRIYGTDDQNISFGSFINIIWQIAVGKMKYDKDDVLTNVDKLLSSFPIKNSSESKE